ncbi:MAG: glycosyltransferase [Thermosynechococcaceae cyanobacterium]
MSIEHNSLLLVLPVPFCHDAKGRLLLEKQACNGINRWAENFQHLIVACPLYPDTAIAHGGTTVDYVAMDELQSRDRVELIPLPWAYQLSTFLKTYRHTRTLLMEKIHCCEYLSFAIGGGVGDWGSVAALEASQQKRRFSVWTDRVEHRVVKGSYRDQKGPKRLYSMIKNNLIISPLMQRFERYIIAKSDLGLFHGRDCFEAYASYCRCPHLVHDIHLTSEDRIPPHQLREKIHRVQSGAPLQLLYAGRAVGMKGPFDWVQVMAKLHSNGVAFRAKWIGDGPLLAELRNEVMRLGLSAVVDFPGFVSDRMQLIQAIRDADLFVFCHKTPESPRCLIEALMSGSPILGYHSPYPQDLVGELASTLLTPHGNMTALAEQILYFDGHRDQLAEMIQQCDQLGSHFSDREVFRHRSDLIKHHLGLKEPLVLKDGLSCG